MRAIKRGQRWANAHPDKTAKWTEEAIGVPVNGNVGATVGTDTVLATPGGTTQVGGNCIVSDWTQLPVAAPAVPVVTSAADATVNDAAAMHTPMRNRFIRTAISTCSTCQEPMPSKGGAVAFSEKWAARAVTLGGAIPFTEVRATVAEGVGQLLPLSPTFAPGSGRLRRCRTGTIQARPRRPELSDGPARATSPE